MPHIALNIHNSEILVNRQMPKYISVSYICFTMQRIIPSSVEVYAAHLAHKIIIYA